MFGYWLPTSTIILVIHQQVYVPPSTYLCSKERKCHTSIWNKAFLLIVKPELQNQKQTHTSEDEPNVFWYSKAFLCRKWLKPAKVFNAVCYTTIGRQRDWASRGVGAEKHSYIRAVFKEQGPRSSSHQNTAQKQFTDPVNNSWIKAIRTWITRLYHSEMCKSISTDEKPSVYTGSLSVWRREGYCMGYCLRQGWNTVRGTIPLLGHFTVFFLLYFFFFF